MLTNTYFTVLSMPVLSTISEVVNPAEHHTENKKWTIDNETFFRGSEILSTRETAENSGFCGDQNMSHVLQSVSPKAERFIFTMFPHKCECCHNS